MSGDIQRIAAAVDETLTAVEHRPVDRYALDFKSALQRYTPIDTWTAIERDTELVRRGQMWSIINLGVAPWAALGLMTLSLSLGVVLTVFYAAWLWTQMIVINQHSRLLKQRRDRALLPAGSTAYRWHVQAGDRITVSLVQLVREDVMLIDSHNGCMVYPIARQTFDTVAACEAYMDAVTESLPTITHCEELMPAAIPLERIEIQTVEPTESYRPFNAQHVQSLLRKYNNPETPLLYPVNVRDVLADAPHDTTPQQLNRG